MENKQKIRKGRRIVLIFVLAAVILLGTYFALTRAVLPNMRYRNAEKLYEEGRYQEAVSAFSVLDGYKDSAERVSDAAYHAAEQLLDEGQFSKALEAFQNFGDYKDSAEKRDECLYRLQRAAMPELAAGETVKFGWYEQDDDPDDGKEEIEWTVLALEGDRALLISKYALDCQPYHKVHGSISWEECSLREWLNDSFLREAFNSAQQKRIPETEVLLPPMRYRVLSVETRDQTPLITLRPESLLALRDLLREAAEAARSSLRILLDDSAWEALLNG